MSFFKFFVSAVSELLTIPSIDPYRTKYEPPQVTGARTDGNGRTVLEVRADNARDVSKITEGVTVAGDVSIVHTRVGRKRWETSVQDWNTEKPALDAHRNDVERFTEDQLPGIRTSELDAWYAELQEIAKKQRGE